MGSSAGRAMSTCRVTVLISDKYNPDRGLQPFEPAAYSGLGERLNKFHFGETDPPHIVDDIIEALFENDFSSTSSKWDVDSASCSLLEEGGYQTMELPLSFECEMKATWDHKDIYSIARSHAKIILQSRDLIHIELYSYYVSG